MRIRLTLVLVAALFTLGLLGPGMTVTAAASPSHNFLGGGGIVSGGPVNFGLGVSGNGTDVSGAFTGVGTGSLVFHFTAKATCLDVEAGPYPGTFLAAAVGRITASSPGFLPVGTLIGIHAFDGDAAGYPDRLSGGGPDCTVDESLATHSGHELLSGDIIITQGS